jgi:hypothetical protein
VVGVAEASTLAPLVYVELLGAALIGYLACDEIPGVLTVAGAVLIVAAGFSSSNAGSRRAFRYLKSLQRMRGSGDEVVSDMSMSDRRHAHRPQGKATGATGGSRRRHHGTPGCIP